MSNSNAKEPGLARLFGVDGRGLAFLRVGLALCVLFDLTSRSTDLYAHYTDFGALPRSDVLRMFAWLHEWPLCIHLASGSEELQAALFVLHAGAAIALLLGYRTTLATLLTWYLTGSVQLRNLLIGGGYDALLRMLLLWGVFLPLGGYFSLDNLRRGRSASLPQSRMFFSVGTVALLAQVVIVYWASGYAKVVQDIWGDGSALRLILHDDFFATSFGQWLGRFPALCSVLTRAVPVVELAGPILLICSGSSAFLRILAVAVLCAMNLGFWLMLNVGLFPWVMSVAVLTFLPSWFWDRALAWRLVRRLKTRAAATAIWQRLAEHARKRPAPAAEPLVSAGARSALREGICALLLVAVIHWNIEVARDRGYSAPWYTTWLVSSLFLQQDWRMFAAPSTRTGWIVIPARLVGGRQIDLMKAGGRAPRIDLYKEGEIIDWTKPPAVLSHYANGRWRMLLRHVLVSNDERPAALLYARYLCREWNNRYSGDDQLKVFQITYVAAPLEEPYEWPSYEPQIIWSHDCFG